MQLATAIGVAFVSGFVALGYEILWARRLSDLIGATAFASSLVVAAFFLFLSAGAAVLGPRATRHARPWRLYAWLEFGVVVAILPAFFGEQLTGVLTQTFGAALLHPVNSFAVKAALAGVFVAPASFLMGGTLPALGQAVVRAERLGREGNALYGINTLGGAAGILVTTFALVPQVGMRLSFVTLMCGSAALALIAWRMSMPARVKLKPVQLPRNTASRPLVWDRWLGLAFASGFLVLGLEVLALHLFAQVLHNSSYTFASVLVIVVLALAVGALVVQRLTLDAQRAWTAAGIVLALAALCIGALPKIFFVATDNLNPFGGGVPGLGAYVARLFRAGSVLLGPAFLCLGFVFPLTFAGRASQARAVGSSWGVLLGFNAGGALLGLLLANHVAMRCLGLWWSLAAWGGLTCMVALVVVVRSAQARALAFGLVAAAATALVIASPRSLPAASTDAGETILAWRAGADGVAAVIDRQQPFPDRRIKWNNTYALGGTGNAAQQVRLGLLPLLLHPHPRDAAFIGMATGITASAALHDPGAPRITAVELSPQITALACEYFLQANSNLCGRSRLYREDGRLFLRATRDSFDVVVADLFVPWQSGTANLYTREHFEAVRAKLKRSGLFAQWLPLFQLDRTGFWGIAATFCAVYPNAWLAIADFQPDNPALVLIGWREADGGPRLDIVQQRCDVMQALQRLGEPMLNDASGVAMFLVGPVAPALPAGIALLTIDHPWLADHAPRVERMRPPQVFTGPELVAELRRVASHVAPGPLRQHVRLGQSIYQFCDIYQRQGAGRAAAWYDAQVDLRLPAHIFRVAQPGMLNWPFTQETGLFLIQRAYAETP